MLRISHCLDNRLIDGGKSVLKRKQIALLMPYYPKIQQILNYLIILLKLLCSVDIFSKFFPVIDDTNNHIPIKKLVFHKLVL
jgi:hypothetical protein